MESISAELWINSLQGAYSELLTSAADIVPKLVIALIVVVAGWAIGAVLGRIIGGIVRAAKVDMALEKAGVKDALSRAGMKLDSGAFVGALVRWFIILVFMVAAFDVLGMDQVNTFLNDVLNFLPKVIVAVLILLFGFVIGDLVHRVVEGSSRAAGFTNASTLGYVAKAAVLVFAVIIALDQIKIVSQFPQILFTGIVAMFSLAGGLAFGLGGRDAAKEYIESTVKKTK